MASFLSGQDSGVLAERGWDGEMEGGGVGEHGCVGGHRCAGDYGMVGGGGRLGGVGGNGCDAAQLFGRQVVSPIACVPSCKVPTELLAI